VDEIEEIPLETSEGARPRSTLSDRLMVGMAALALLAGVVIAGANFLGGLDDGVAAASGAPSSSNAPQASRTAPPSPTPRALRELTIIPGKPDDPPPEGRSVPMGWVEIVAPTVMQRGPSDASEVMRQLPAGEILLAYLDDPVGWASTVASDQSDAVGWVRSTDAAGKEVAIFHPVDDETYPGQVSGVWAGPEGLLAMVAPPQNQYAASHPYLASSRDGERWTPISTDPALAATYPQIAWGAQGWLAIGVPYWTQNPWIWQSYDGLQWEALGALPVAPDAGWPSQLAGSKLGYLLIFEEYRSNGTMASTWFSPDGITWQEAADPFGRTDAQRTSPNRSLLVLATGFGFLVWTASYDATDSAGTQVAFSADGVNWSPVELEDPAVAANLQLAIVGDTVLGLGSGPDGATRAWRAHLADGGSMQLSHEPSLEAPFAGALGVLLGSNGVTAHAIGYLPGAGTSRAWSSDGSSWRIWPGTTPPQFSPRTSIGAVGPDGLVVVDYRSSAMGENPVFWHLRPNGTWVVEAAPIVPMVPDPTPADCGPLPTTGLQFALIRQNWGPICFGDQPLTFTAWSAPCDWCSNEPVQDGPWLLDAQPQLALRPVPGDPWPNREAVLDPSLQVAVDLSEVWLRLTGHFSDPAAAECAYPTGWIGGYYGPSDEAVRSCRGRFVVTALEVVPPPAG
jgi:hypothetical protein